MKKKVQREILFSEEINRKKKIKENREKNEYKEKLISSNKKRKEGRSEIE